MNQMFRVAGYVKLAKLWERSADKAMIYHRAYYQEKYEASEHFVLKDVYVDITGQKEISRSPEMLRLLRDCLGGEVDCIAAQTKGYLAANTKEFCYLIRLLFDSNHRIDIITEDNMYHIDTLLDEEQQREALHKMACDYIDLNPEEYEKWKLKILRSIDTLKANATEGG